MEIPSFGEFAFYTVSVFSTRPVMMLALGNNGCSDGADVPCQGSDFETVSFQNLCLICTAVFAFYHIASDRRRDWLNSFEIFGPLNDVGPAYAAKLTHSLTKSAACSYRKEFLDGGIAHSESTGTRNAGVSYDLETDSYFPAEERAEQLQLWRSELEAIATRATDAQGRPTPRWKRLRGASASSPVHLAADQDTGERLAAKILPGGPAHAAFVRNEALRMQSLSHPGLAGVLGGGARGTRWVWILAEYCDGGSVEALLRRRRGPLQAEEAGRLGRQAGEAVAYLHRHGLLHGNLKVDPGPPQSLAMAALQRSHD